MRSVTPEEFMAARQTLPDTDAELAATLGVPEGRVTDWSTGRHKIPGDVAHFLGTMSTIMRREAALADSGLPECAWVGEHFTPSRIQAARLSERSRQLWKHRASCAVCQARERYALASVGPVSDVPYRSAAMRVVDAIESAWSVVVWVGLLVTAVMTDMWREPLLWVILALPLLFRLYFRWRR
jgi:hypothetical protein